jgi:hypothetical protein
MWFMTTVRDLSPNQETGHNNPARLSEQVKLRGSRQSEPVLKCAETVTARITSPIQKRTNVAIYMRSKMGVG